MCPVRPAANSVSAIVQAMTGSSLQSIANDTTTVTTALTLVPTDAGTDVSWVADITALNGLLKMVPRGLIQSAAQKVIADVWQSVRAAVAATSPPRPASSG